jgi:hypothetical protein
MSTRRFIYSLAFMLMLGPSAASAADGDVATNADSFSRANQLLFLEDHLTQTEYPARYTYEFVKSGSAADDFEDRITMIARNVAGSDAKHVELQVFRHDRERQVPDIDNARGNPLIMVFLQTDVLDLAKATGGHWRYFQKQMKLALENGARVEPVTVEFQGEAVEGQRITVKPYAGEQAHREAMGRYVDKTYEFVISDQVPGKIVELRTTVPPEDGTDGPQVERLTLQSVERIDVQG